MDSGFEVFLYAAVDGCSAHKGKRLYKGISEYLEKACQMVYLEYCGIWTILRTAFSRCDIWRKLVYRSARPLDFTRWSYLFENGSCEDFLSVLSAYQNEDGGL